jgi:hypothetical protein
MDYKRNRVPKFRVELMIASPLLVLGAAGLAQSAKTPVPGAKTGTPVSTSITPGAIPGTTKVDFAGRIAPLLTTQCVPCHNSAKHKGGLDLSQLKSALAGGERGPALKPGKPDESLLWKLVQKDEMPPGKPLDTAQKRFLRDWVTAGAPWPTNLVSSPPNAATSAPNWLRRLTIPEYIETVRSAVGVDIEEDARRLLPPDLRADGFSNTAYNLKVDLAHIEAYAHLAEIIAARMDVAAFITPYAKSPELSEPNLRSTIASMGQWLLRGPLDAQEITAFLAVAKTIAADGGDFNAAMRLVLEAMLQSPRFVYRVERQRGDGNLRQVDTYELASRLSYILWGGPPDKELMRAAVAGELIDRNQVAKQAQRMLQNPLARQRSYQFMHEWLDLDRLNHIQPSKARFKNWDKQLAADMRAETLAFFEEVAWKQKRPLSDLLNAQVTFTTPRLAEHYGLAPKVAPASLDGLQVLYNFAGGSSDKERDTVRDTSGHAEPLNLKIADVSAVKWERDGLAVHQSTLITAPTPKRLIEALKKSKAFSIEVWITPGEKKQSGPARIVTLSSGPSERNFTLGQDESNYQVRLRTTKSDANGMPALSSSSGVVETNRTHLVYTCEATGAAKLYINGVERGMQEGTQEGASDFANWNDGFQLALANETSKDRAWKGTFHLVALYSRSLKPSEISVAKAGVTEIGAKTDGLNSLMRHDLSGVPSRGGLLTQGSLLTIGGEEASMVERGLFVLHDLLYSEVGNAPPGVDTTPVPAKPGFSKRAIAQKRLDNPACGGCHAKFEPLAFALEKYDGVGAWSETDEHGNKLREDGTILLPGQNKPLAYKSTRELMDLLARSERVKRNLTRKMTQFALGRPLAEADEAAIEKIHSASQKGGGHYESLMTAIVTSDLVSMIPTEKSP